MDSPDLTLRGHSRQSSHNSAYSLSLASAINLAPVQSSPLLRGSSKSRFLSKFKNKTKHRTRASDDMDWVCRGEDLESNFQWPPQGWQEETTRRSPSPPPLILPDSAASFSSDSSLSDTILTPLSSRPASVSPSISTESEYEVLASPIKTLPSPGLIEYLRQPIGYHDSRPPAREAVTHPGLVALTPSHPQEVDTKPESASKRPRVRPVSMCVTSPTSEEIKARPSSVCVTDSGEYRRKQEEMLALEAINQLFTTKSTLNALEGNDGRRRRPVSMIVTNTIQPRHRQVRLSGFIDARSIPEYLPSPARFSFGDVHPLASDKEQSKRRSRPVSTYATIQSLPRDSSYHIPRRQSLCLPSPAQDAFMI